MSDRISYIARLIEDFGCDCDHDCETLEDHTCDAGKAEMEWRTLHEEIADLKRQLAEATEWRTDQPPRDGSLKHIACLNGRHVFAARWDQQFGWVAGSLVIDHPIDGWRPLPPVPCRCEEDE